MAGALGCRYSESKLQLSASLSRKTRKANNRRVTFCRGHTDMSVFWGFNNPERQTKFPREREFSKGISFWGPGPNVYIFRIWDRIIFKSRIRVPAVSQWVKNSTAAVPVASEAWVQFLAQDNELKDPALLQLWHRLYLWLRFNPWPGNIHVPWIWL